jgi:polyisoprenoid-binding protein YceI
MKTFALRNLHFVTGNVGLALALVLVLAVSFSIPAHAQETWRLDPQLSIARLSLGPGSNALEIGLARVSGDVVFDSNDLTDPSVNLKITPGRDSFQSRLASTDHWKFSQHLRHSSFRE